MDVCLIGAQEEDGASASLINYIHNIKSPLFRVRVSDMETLCISIEDWNTENKLIHTYQIAIDS